MKKFRKNCRHAPVDACDGSIVADEYYPVDIGPSVQYQYKGGARA